MQTGTVPAVPPDVFRALERYAPQRAIVFGSAVRGDADAGSDIDLLLEKETPRPFLERLVEFSRLLPPGGTRVDAFIYTPEEFEAMREQKNPIVTAALREGKTIYETPAGGP